MNEVCLINIAIFTLSLKIYTHYFQLRNHGSEGNCKDGGGIGREDHFLPHKFLKRTFQRRANSTKQLL